MRLMLALSDGEAAGTEACNDSYAGAAGALGAPALGATPATEFYAMADDISPVARAAQRVRERLLQASASSADPWWAVRFWRAIHQEDQAGLLPAPVIAVLRAHGYIGAATRAAPGAEELATTLQHLVTQAVAFNDHSITQGDEFDRWATSLPPDCRRAAPEIFKNMRAAGSPSVRQWLQENFKGSRTAAAFTDLWSVATSIDFALGPVRSDAERFTALSTSDQLEIQLRHIAAHVYESRTHDFVGASRIRAIVAPGTGVDVAPSWLVSDATTHSKQEHQRTERVSSELKRRGNQKGDKDDGKGKTPKGDGRGKGGKGKDH